MRLEAERISFAYRPGVDVLRGVDLTVDAGEVVFLLGANGSGKTTLLQCLAGVRTPQQGVVRVDDQPLGEFAPRERARRIGLVPQIHEPVFSYSVGEVVLMGRAPHLGTFGRPGRRDWNEVDRALCAVGIADLRGRPYTATSGGERQLALIARGLAQGAACLLMDEPGAHLDPGHQHDVLTAVVALAQAGFSFVVTSHQPNAALLYADRVAFLNGGRAAVQGAPREVIDEATLRDAYGMAFEIVEGLDGARAVLPRVPRRFSWDGPERTAGRV